MDEEEEEVAKKRVFAHANWAVSIIRCLVVGENEWKGGQNEREEAKLPDQVRNHTISVPLFLLHSRSR